MTIVTNHVSSNRLVSIPYISLLLTEPGHLNMEMFAQCGFRVVTIDPLHFLAECRTRRLNQA